MNMYAKEVEFVRNSEYNLIEPLQIYEFNNTNEIYNKWLKKAFKLWAGIHLLLEMER